MSATDLSYLTTGFEWLAKYGADCRYIGKTNKKRQNLHTLQYLSYEGLIESTYEYNVWPDLQNRMYWLGGAN